jgi:hypothetical protein
MHYQGDRATPAAIAPTHKIADGRSVLFNINVYTVIRKRPIYNLDCGTLVGMPGMLAGILHLLVLESPSSRKRLL